MAQRCEGGCEHTDIEHEAFDSGLRAGEEGEPEDVPGQFRGDTMQREGWLTGYAVGVSNRVFEANNVNARIALVAEKAGS